MIPLGLITAGLGNQALAKARLWGNSGTNRSLDNWFESHEGFSGALGLVLLVLLVNFILVIVWMNAAYKHQTPFAPGNRRWSSGWTIGGWFIPFANFIIPKLVLNEIERVAGSNDDELNTSRWRQTKLNLNGYWYWLGWVAASICFGGSTVWWDGRVDARHVEDVVLSNVETFYQLNIAGSLFIGVAGLFGAIYYRYLARQLKAGSES